MIRKLLRWIYERWLVEAVALKPDELIALRQIAYGIIYGDPVSIWVDAWEAGYEYVLSEYGLLISSGEYLVPSTKGWRELFTYLENVSDKDCWIFKMMATGYFRAEVRDGETVIVLTQTGVLHRDIETGNRRRQYLG